MYYSQMGVFIDQLVSDTVRNIDPDLRARWTALLLLLGPDTQPLGLAEKLRSCFNQNPDGDTEPARFPEDHAGYSRVDCG